MTDPGSDGPGPDNEALETAATVIRDAAFDYVLDDRGVRVEDYVATLAAVTGEAALVSSGVVDIEAAPVEPGTALFGPPIDEVLTGDTTDLFACGPETVAGLLRDGLAGHLVPPEVLDLGRVVRWVAEHVGRAPWGQASLSVPADNRPAVIPLRAAFEMRPAVVTACAPLSPDGAAYLRGRHVPCALALVSALEQTAEAIDPAVSVTLAIEIAFTMAKMMPMSLRRMQELGG